MEINDTVFHGTTKQGLKSLKPFVSSHQKPYVYASCSYAMASLFIAKKHGDFFTRIDIKNGQLYVAERMPNILEEIYKDVSGSIYELNGRQFFHTDGLMSIECVSSKEVFVKREIIIPNALDLLYELEKKGDLSIYKFDNLPSWIPADKSDLVEKSVQWTLEFGEDTLKVLRKYHPDLVDKVIDKVKRLKDKK